MTDSRYAAGRLMVTLTLMTIGASGMYIVPVVLPTVQAEFGVARADASMPYSLLMIGFELRGILMRLADRFGVRVALLSGAAGLGLGFAAASSAGSIWTFILVHGFLIGLFGCSATFAPLIADTSLWFVRRRKLPGRRDLARRRPALRRKRRLAPDVSRAGRLLLRHDDRARATHAPPPASFALAAN
jgi:MFS family permease